MTNIGIRNQFTREVVVEKTLKQIPAGFRALDVGAGKQPLRKPIKTIQEFARLLKQGGPNSPRFQNLKT